MSDALAAFATMLGGDGTRLSPVEAIVTGLRSELRKAGADGGPMAVLLGTADELLRRATIDIDCDHRRRDRRHDLAEIVGLGSSTKELPDLDALIDTASDRMRTLIEADVAGDEVAREQVVRLVSLLVDTDLPSAPRPAAVESGPDDSTDAAAELTVEQLTDYLATRFPDAKPPVVATGIQRLSGGFSKDTLAASIEGMDGVTDIVLRKVAAGRSAAGLAEEYNVVSFAFRHGIPVAEPLWLEEGEMLSTPFFVTRRANGQNVGDVFGASGPVAQDLAKHLAKIVAHLHSLDPAEVKSSLPGAGMATREQALKAVEQSEAMVNLAAGDARVPLFDALYTWLRVHVPQDAAHPVLLHGDVGFHNMLASGSQVEVVLDWEGARMGDPAEELAYLRPSVEPIMPWGDFLDIYIAHGGKQPDPSAFRFFTVWQDVWRAAACFGLRANFQNNPTRLSDAVAGFLFFPRFLGTAVSSAFGVKVVDPV